MDSVAENGDTAADSAIIGDKKENLEYLLSSGAPVGKNSLRHATRTWTGVDILTILVNHGALLDDVDEDGDNAVDGAIRTSSIRCNKKDQVEYLSYVLVLMGFLTLPNLVTSTVKTICLVSEHSV